jgi:Rieske Fe-S protein
MADETNRRSFLQLAIFGIGGAFSALLGVPIVAYVLDPRHRKGGNSDFKLVEGIRLDELERGKPAQGVVRDTRTDAWNLYPNDVVGRVWVVKVGERPAALNSQAQKDAFLLVFTTICPHLGCSVNLNGAGTGFQCPCHGAAFDHHGSKLEVEGHSNPANRPMDMLEWQIDELDPERILVKYENFEPSIAEKKKVG